MTDLARIRNFSIVAHIDHGKSTLADRLIQETNTVALRDMKEQMLDAMDIERERGITIKANTVRIDWTAADGLPYVLNLIDTPGHVDFAYEVSRSMRAVEGSLLVVDCTQGVEAQTLANVYQAIDADHEIVPVLNKIDLPASEPDRVREQIEDVIGIDASQALLVSAKTGQGITETLQAIVDRLPPPQGDPDAPLKAMLVDSLVRQLPRRHRPRPRDRRPAAKGRARALHGQRHHPPRRPHRRVPPAHDRDRRPRPGRDRLPDRLDQAGPRHPRRRHHHPREAPHRQGAARLQALPARRLLRPLPRRRRRVRGPARRHREALAQRRLLLLGSRDLRRARLRLPLRLPRASCTSR